jgi:hypothetical protein
VSLLIGSVAVNEKIRKPSRDGKVLLLRKLRLAAALTRWTVIHTFFMRLL